MKDFFMCLGYEMAMYFVVVGEMKVSIFKDLVVEILSNVNELFAFLVMRIISNDSCSNGLETIGKMLMT